MTSLAPPPGPTKPGLRLSAKYIIRAMSEDVRDATSSLELLVTFHCTSDGSSETRNLVLSPRPSRIEDIKNYIQAKESIPKCLQKLTLKDHVLSNSQSLDDLYIRSEDSVTCTYLARADVEPLEKFIHSSLHPVLTRLQADASKLSQFHPEKDVKMLLHHCELTFHSVAYAHLLPWASVTSEANRQFLVQEGGIDHTMQLYALLLQVPWVERHLLLQRLELSCLTLLWNFAETASARQLVVEKEGFPMMLQSLMHYSQEEFLEKYRMYDIFDTAIGCVSKYVATHVTVELLLKSETGCRTRFRTKGGEPSEKRLLVSL